MPATSAGMTLKLLSRLLDLGLGHFMNTIDLEGRIAIVTGGARGIGFAIAQRMLKSGAKVVLWDLDKAAMDAASMALQASGPVYVDTVDVTDETSVGNAADSHM